jgi:hypothetical protein
MRYELMNIQLPVAITAASTRIAPEEAIAAIAQEEERESEPSECQAAAATPFAQRPLALPC